MYYRICPTSSCIANALGDENLNCPHSSRCPVRFNTPTCVLYNANCTAPHCLGKVHCAGTPCPAYEGMDCFYDGSSDNFKLCYSSGCYVANTNNTASATASSRLPAKAVVTVASGGSCAALPQLQTLGGNVFLSALAATLNIYKDRIDNLPCGGDNPDYMETLVS